MNSVIEYAPTGREIAVIGMACRAPGVRVTAELWQLSKFGKEGLSTFTREELKQTGVTDILLNDANYVMKAGYLADKNSFDASLFGYNSRQAGMMDPQIAKFHECAWEALEQAGYYTGRVGVYAGSGDNSVWQSRIMSECDSAADAYNAESMTGPDFLSTRISYNFNLTGPSQSIQTACSTSLVAVHEACQSLLTHQCEMALAGGSSISPEGIQGYLFQEGMIMSPDGCCRPFDASASGTAVGEGTGVVVLKRLGDAIADNDNILAVIKGTAINNDGNRKQAFTAPSVLGQSETIYDALEIAEVEPTSIGYVETHGTGTHLGDPIEIAALTDAYGPKAIESKGAGYCVIGALKSLIGHTDTGAGVLGLIRAIQVLQHKQFPPSAYFKSPNSELNLANTPFQVNTILRPWESDGPRRAGVSAFGIGGTNAHVILEEACFERQTSSSRKAQMVFLMANTETALVKINDELVQYLEKFPETSLPDLCYTFHVGRKPLTHRKAMTVTTLEELKRGLSGAKDATDKTSVYSGRAVGDNKICFLFPGQGGQYANMSKSLYEEEPVFREWMDKCFAIAQEALGIDFKTILFTGDESDTRVNQTANTQPLLFMLEYSLAQLLMHWGCKPDIMIGHSVGEYVAACLAGVFSLDDAISLIIRRGALVQELPSGAMLSVLTSESTIKSLIYEKGGTQALKDQLSIAAINSPERLVVSGDKEAINTLQNELDQQDIQHVLLQTSHAFHSQHMEPILERFREVLKTISFSSPEIPYISNVSGKEITTEQAMSPAYWLQHLRHCVQFSKGVESINELGNYTYIEVGPGKALGTFVVQNSGVSTQHVPISLIPSAMESLDKRESEQSYLLKGMCQLFVYGTSLNWDVFYSDEKRGRISLPTYPFEGKSYWTPGQSTALPVLDVELSGKKADMSDWFYLPAWRPVASSCTNGQGVCLSEPKNSKSCWLVFEDDYGLGKQLRVHINGHDYFSINVRKGKSFSMVDENNFQINPQDNNDYLLLAEALNSLSFPMIHIIHLWSVYLVSSEGSVSLRFGEAQQQGFNSLIHLVQALNIQCKEKNAHISIITSNLQQVSAHSSCCPEKAGVLGLNRVISQEYPQLSSRSIDICLTEEGDWQKDLKVEQLFSEISSSTFPSVSAIRNGILWKQKFEPIFYPIPKKYIGLRRKGVYLITGGLGKIGTALAEFLAVEYTANIILITRSYVPPKSQWEEMQLQSPLAEKLKKLNALEKLGARIDIFSTDVAIEKEMEKVFAWIDNNYGTLHGVMHAAADINMEIIETINVKKISKNFIAKIEGTENIFKFINRRSLDFCMLFSSISTILGGLGFASYAAANCFMDSFVQKISINSKTPWICVNWDGWNFTQPEDPKGKNIAGQYDFSSDEGMELIRRLLSLYTSQAQMIVSNSQIVISTGDLNGRYHRYVCETFFHEKEKQSTTALVAHTRPELPAEYKEPQSDIEVKLAEIWTKVLGLDHVGIEDNFFDLGGDSLLMISIHKRIAKALDQEIPIAILFQYPSISLLTLFLAKGVEKSKDRQDTLRKSKQRLAKLRNKVH